MLEEKPQLGDWLRQKQEEPLPRSRRSERARGALLFFGALMVLGLPFSTVLVFEELAFFASRPPLQTISGVPSALHAKETRSRRGGRTTYQYVKMASPSKGQIVFLEASGGYGYPDFAAAMASNQEITFEYYDVDCDRRECTAMRGLVEGRVIFDNSGRHQTNLVMYSIYWALGMLSLIFFIRSLRKFRKPRIAQPIVRR